MSKPILNPVVYEYMMYDMHGCVVNGKDNMACIHEYIVIRIFVLVFGEVF